LRTHCLSRLYLCGRRTPDPPLPRAFEARLQHTIGWSSCGNVHVRGWRLNTIPNNVGATLEAALKQCRFRLLLKTQHAFSPITSYQMPQFTSALAKRLNFRALLVLYNTAQSDPFDAPMSPQASPVYPKSVGTSRFSEREKVTPLSAATVPSVAHKCTSKTS